MRRECDAEVCQQAFRLLQQGCAPQPRIAYADLSQQGVGNRMFRIRVVLPDPRMEVLQSGAGGGTDDHRVEDGIDIRRDDPALPAFPQPVEILGRHLHEEGDGTAQVER